MSLKHWRFLLLILKIHFLTYITFPYYASVAHFLLHEHVLWFTSVMEKRYRKYFHGQQNLKNKVMYFPNTITFKYETIKDKHSFSISNYPFIISSTAAYINKSITVIIIKFDNEIFCVTCNLYCNLSPFIDISEKVTPNPR